MGEGILSCELVRVSSSPTHLSDCNACTTERQILEVVLGIVFLLPVEWYNMYKIDCRPK